MSTQPDESVHAIEARARTATGQEIARRRGALGLTQADLAAKSQVPPSVIARWERGNAVLIDLWQLRAMSAVLGVSAGQLIDAHQSAAGSPGNRGPVFVVHAGTPAHPREVGPDKATYWRLIRYDATDVGTLWQPPGPEEGRTVSRDVIAWASQVLGTAAYVVGSAQDLTGGRSWYVGTTGPRPDGPSGPSKPGGPGGPGGPRAATRRRRTTG